MINVLEIIMIITTVMYSYLLIYCKRSGFIFGIVSTGIMGYVFVKTGVYVQAILNFVYAIMYVYSYFNWGSKKAPNIRSISKREIILSLITCFVFTLTIGYTFKTMGETHPYIDSFGAVCSIIAVLLLSKKVIEHAYIFVVANIASIIICYISEDYITIVTILIYMIFNIFRGIVWRKEVNKNKEVI